MGMFDYPKMLYKRGGSENIAELQDEDYSTRIVDNEEDEAAAVADGFGPYTGRVVAAKASKPASDPTPASPAWGKPPA